jgi:hypothetical protein
MKADHGRRAERTYLVAFLAGAALLVWAAVRGPEWAGPLVLVCLGLLSAAVPRPTPETERLEGAPRARRSVRRISLFATVVGLVLLMRALGVL